MLCLNNIVKSKLLKSSTILNKLLNNGMKNLIKLCLLIVLRYRNMRSVSIASFIDIRMLLYAYLLMTY
jgi:hypothetical protein